MSSVIELDGVGKRYRLGEHHGNQTDLRETLAGFARRLRHAPSATCASSGRSVT